MPNWCSNIATVTFPTPDKAAEFVENCTMRPSRPIPGTLFDMTEAHEPELFNIYHPMPSPEDDTNRWYDWRCANWGTKWNPTVDSVLQMDDCTVQITFDTAWGPPVEWLDACGEKHNWNWELIYIESGMGFAGTASGDKTGRTSEEQFTDGDPEYKGIGEEYFGIVWEDEDEGTHEGS